METGVLLVTGKLWNVLLLGGCLGRDRVVDEGNVALHLVHVHGEAIALLLVDHFDAAQIPGEDEMEVFQIELHLLVFQDFFHVLDGEPLAGEGLYRLHNLRFQVAEADGVSAPAPAPTLPFGDRCLVGGQSAELRGDGATGDLRHDRSGDLGGGPVRGDHRVDDLVAVRGPELRQVLLEVVAVVSFLLEKGTHLVVELLRQHVLDVVTMHCCCSLPIFSAAWIMYPAHRTVAITARIWHANRRAVAQVDPDTPKYRDRASAFPPRPRGVVKR